MKQSNIIVYGFNNNEIETIKQSVPTQKCELIDTDCYTDLIAIPCFAQVIDVKVLKENELDVVVDYYSLIGSFSETIIFIGEVNFSKKFRKKLIIFNDFSEFSNNIKNILLGAYNKHKKSSY